MDKQKRASLKFKAIEKRVLIIIIAFVGFTSFSQIKMGDNTTTVDLSTVLELESTDKGFLPPRLTTVQRDALSVPATGLVIYNTTANNLQTNVGTSVSPIWSDGSVTASNGLTLSGSNVTLGGNLTGATVINQNNNDLTFTTGTAKTIVDGTLKTTGAVYVKVRKVTSLPIVWQDDDYIILLTVSGAQDINFPAPGGANTGRVIIIRNNSTDNGGANGIYRVTQNIPYGTFNAEIGTSRGHTYISDGTAWYLINGA